MSDDTRVQIWHILSDGFGTILRLVRGAVPGVSLTTGYSQNDAFVFRAFAQFRANGQVVVISFDIQMKDSHVYTFDYIDSENGEIIKDITQTVIESAAYEDVIINRVKEFISECEGTVALIVNELRQFPIKITD